MTNLDSVLKRKTIILSTKVCIVKAKFFTIVVYCESWTIKKAEHRADAFELVMEKILESPVDCKEIKLINPKGNQPWIFIGGLMLKLELQYFEHLMVKATWWSKPIHWKSPWCWEGPKATGEGAGIGWDGETASQMQYTWIW